MRDYVTIKIDADELLDLLVARVERFVDDYDIIGLYEKMYENWIDNGFYDAPISISELVDNDVINYCHVVEEGDDEYESIKEFYEENGLGDISEITPYSWLEAENNGLFLVRY